MKVEFTEEAIEGKLRITARLNLEADVFIDPDEIASAKSDLREVAKDFLIEKMRREVFGTLKVDFVKFVTVHRNLLHGMATSSEIDSAFQAVMSTPERLHK